MEHPVDTGRASDFCDSTALQTVVRVRQDQVPDRRRPDSGKE